MLAKRSFYQGSFSVASTARAAFNRPKPSLSLRPVGFEPVILSLDCSKTPQTVSRERSFRAASMSAPTPAAIGVDAEVPPNNEKCCPFDPPISGFEAL